MRGAFYVATAFFIASSIRTAAESAQIKSVITQNHDKCQPVFLTQRRCPEDLLKGVKKLHWLKKSACLQLKHSRVQDTLFRS
ncbi:hypothetical protein Plhal710r2_c025g0100091 [Plasmopara halstedii]